MSSDPVPSEPAPSNQVQSDAAPSDRVQSEGPPDLVRAGSGWLAVREPADAAARSVELVDELRARLPSGGVLVVHDLGSGTGSMARWLAPQLEVAQRWILYDRDEDLLREAATLPAPTAGDGSAVTVETRALDVTRLTEADLADADLITASALLDMLGASELTRLVDACACAGCPVLITLSVVGRVDLTPADPLDEHVMSAFNAHQRRSLGTERLLGPDAARAAVEVLSRRGLEVTTRPSPWVLDHRHSAVVQQWLAGWLAAALEQQPDLRELAGDYVRRRTTEAAEGQLSVTVHHEDVLAVRRT